MRPILITSAIVLCLSQPLYASTQSQPLRPANNTKPDTETHKPGNAANMPSLAARGSWQALALGREVYRDLLRAQRAASEHNEIDTRLALHDASQVLDSFYEPAVSRALRRQMGVIREDLAGKVKPPREQLWLPLEAELDKALLVAPSDHRVMAKTALQEGHAAAAKGDRDSARKKLDVLEEVLNYRWGLLPLNKVRGDVHSAEMALDPAPPYWKGIDEAMQSALAAVQWVSTTQASGWFSAYEEAVHARMALPEHPQLARAALDRAGNDLEGLNNATDLARKAHQLAAQSQPEGKAVESLLRDLRAGITP